MQPKSNNGILQIIHESDEDALYQESKTDQTDS